MYFRFPAEGQDFAVTLATPCTMHTPRCIVLWPTLLAVVVLVLATGCKKEEDEGPNLDGLRAELVGDGNRVWTPHFAIFIRPDSTNFDTLTYISLNPVTGQHDTVSSNRPIQQRFTAGGQLFLSSLNGPGGAQADFKVWQYELRQPETVYISNDTTPATAYQQAVRFNGDTLWMRLVRVPTTSFYNDYQVVYLRNQ